MKIDKSLFLTAVMMTLPSLAFSQSYYDDDIYFDASKAPKESKKTGTSRTSAVRYSDSNVVTAPDGQSYIISDGYAYPVSPIDFQGSDSYVVNSGSTRDVDEYNRRYQVVDTVSVDSLSRYDFANTRLIERFSNPQIVTGSGDDDLIDYYVASQQPSEVNIYLSTSGYPYYRYPYSSFYWNSWGYDPWFGGWYDPYWSYAGYWGPGWGWGPGYWGPGWGPSWSWGPGYYPGVWVPSRPGQPGATRPHRPNGGYASGSGAGGYRGNYGGGVNRPSSSGGYRGNGYIPSSGSSRPAGTDTYRPSGSGNSGGGYRPSSGNSGGYRPSSGNSGNRQSGTYGGGRRSNSNNSYNNNRSSNSNSSFSSPSRSSSGGFGGGGMRGGSSGGGSRGGGGRSGRH